MIKEASLLALLGCLAGCAGTPPPPMIGGGPAPDRRANATDSASHDPDGTLRIAPALGYQAVARLERQDSIILTLPSGQRQIQQTSRTARFSLAVSPTGEVEVRLDSLHFTPDLGSAAAEAIGTRWQGQLDRHGLSELSANRDNGVVKDLTSAIAELFPILPRSGVAVGEQWADTSRSTRRVEIFDADDRRQGSWQLGRARSLDGLMVHPITAAETYEQLGEGEQAGRTMRMSAQGSRRATYYVTRAGRIDQIVQVDSASRLITIPETRQAIPTTQVIRTRVAFRYGG